MRVSILICSSSMGTTIDVKNYVISINIPVAISQYSFYLKVMDDWQTLNKSVCCIRRLPSLIRKLWKLYDELLTYDKVTNSEVDVQKLTYEKLMTHLGKTFDSL